MSELKLIFSVTTFRADFLLVSWEDTLHAQRLACPETDLVIHTFNREFFDNLLNTYARREARHGWYLSEHAVSGILASRFIHYFITIASIHVAHGKPC